MPLPKLFDPDRSPSPPEGRSNEIISRVPPYVYTEETVAAVNLALATGRPLLLMGGPGTGKSSLAPDVARQLGWRYLEYVLTARTDAQDLLWYRDDLRRLSDAQQGRLEKPEAYIRRGVVWQAFATAETGVRAVILLEDIDRANEEVVNTLLHVLGSLHFTVPDIGEVVVASGDVRPLVVTTASEEHPLPARLVSRCVRVRLPTPNVDQLMKIANAHGLLGCNQEPAERKHSALMISA